MYTCYDHRLSLQIDQQPFLIENVHLNISTHLLSSFSGLVTIDLKLFDATNQFLLHAGKTLNINKIKLNGSLSNWILLDKDILLIKIGRFISPGAYQIKIFYHSTFNAGGFHLLPNYHSVAFTNFEPISARTVFPCLDLPSFKTTYSASFTVNASFQVRFNTEAHFEEILNEERHITFPKTIPLPSYLVAWYIYPHTIFHIHTKKKKDYPAINIFSPHSSFSVVSLSLDIAQHCMEYFTEYFDYSLPTSKIDLLPVPFFASEGMENWGLITIESAVLENLGDILSSLQYGSTLIAHEIVHHWTGDLVTMVSFNDLWMNEAFAEYFQYLPFIDGPFSNLTSIDDIFYLNEYNLAFYADMFSCSHPIVPTENFPYYFDDITYNKGAVVLRLLNDMLSTNFSMIMKDYIHQFALTSVATSDFFHVVEKYIPTQLLSNFEKFWLRGVGYPLVEVKILNNTLILEQKNPICLNCDWIPHPLRVKAKIFYNTHKEYDLLEIDFFDTRKSISLSSEESNVRPLAILDSGISGFYRVLYMTEDTLAHADILSFLSAQERCSYIDNMIESLIRGNTNTSSIGSVSFLERTLKFMQREQDTAVWQMFAVSISRFEEAIRLLKDVHSQLLSWVNFLLSQHIDNALFAINDIILTLALQFQNELAIDQSLSLYEGKIYDPKLEPFVLTGVIRYHGKFLEIWKSKERHSLKDLIYFSATSDKNEQDILLKSYSSDTKALSIILEQFSRWGHYKVAWDSWKTNPIRLRIDLERLVRQMTDIYYIKQAEKFAPFSTEIERGLERGKQIRNFTQQS